MGQQNWPFCTAFASEQIARRKNTIPKRIDGRDDFLRIMGI
jgi:hypothetical protein